MTGIIDAILMANNFESKSKETTASKIPAVPKPPPTNYRVGTFPILEPTKEHHQTFYKTIHTVFGLWSPDDEVPMKDLETWKTLNPEWQVVIHNRKESDHLVKENFKWLEPIYRNANRIQQADLIRLLFVYEYGGIYTDVE